MVLMMDFQEHASETLAPIVFLEQIEAHHLWSVGFIAQDRIG
jgi:hypothetical protein